MKAKTKKQKRLLLNELKDNPIVERACKRVGIARSTFYRWSGVDQEFKAAAQDAQKIGRDRMNDFAESKLIENVNDGEMQAIRFWLTFNSKRYAGVSAAELKRLRFFETVVFDLLNASANKDDFAIVRIFAELRKQAEQQIEEEKNRTEL